MSRQKSPSDLHRSIGQILIMGFDGTEMSPGLAALLTRMQPAGVILFARNITGGGQTYKLLKDCQARVSTPLFTAVDMEGGRVDRFRNVIGRSPSAADVVGSAKHFPGLGEANLDTHEELPSINKPWKKIWAEDLYPYRALRRELPMVLIGHANYPAITHDQSPASLSKEWITDVLRKKIGYRGLVVSDDLEMGGVLKASPIEQAAIEHIRAGGDLCLICHIEEYVTRSYEALLKEAEGNRKFAQRVADAATRVLAFKKKSSALKRRSPAPSPQKLEKLSRQLRRLSEQIGLSLPRASASTSHSSLSLPRAVAP